MARRRLEVRLVQRRSNDAIRRGADVCDNREKLHQAASYGYKGVSEDAIDWPALKNKRDKYIERLNGIYERSP